VDKKILQAMLKQKDIEHKNAIKDLESKVNNEISQKNTAGILLTP